MSEFKGFRDLTVWQKAMDLAASVYRITKEFPADERFGLTSQMRRAAVSIPSNIAEGHARNSTGEFIQALGVAKGSLAELETQAEIAERLQMITRERNCELRTEMNEVGRMLNGLLNSLRSKS
jgi:four helix bundle protein